MSRLVTFRIPADFILKHCTPTGPEIAYGLEHGWVSRQDVVAIAVAKLAKAEDTSMSEGEKELALILSDDLDRVDEIASHLAKSDEPVESRARLWLFLALSWLREHREEFEDPYEVIEMLYADFDYPPEIAHLIRWMPANASQPKGLDALEQKWQEYVSSLTKEYLERECKETDSS